MEGKASETGQRENAAEEGTKGDRHTRLGSSIATPDSRQRLRVSMR